MILVFAPLLERFAEDPVVDMGAELRGRADGFGPESQSREDQYDLSGGAGDYEDGFGPESQSREGSAEEPVIHMGTELRGRADGFGPESQSREDQYDLSSGAGDYEQLPLQPFRSCDLGTVYDDELGSCQACPVGAQFLPQSSSCVCQAGFATEEATGDAACGRCRPGSFSEEPGASACARCPEGSYASEVGATSCVDCAADRTTLAQGAESSEECVCRAQSYRPRDSDECRSCGAGLACEAGSMEANIPSEGAEASGPHPRILPGYYSLESEPMSVYLCRDNLTCPGGLPETCATGRAGLACGACKPGYYEAAGAECAECSDHASRLPLFLLPPFGALFCLVFAWRSQDDKDKWTSPPNAYSEMLFVCLSYMQSLPFSVLPLFFSTLFCLIFACRSQDDKDNWTSPANAYSEMLFVWLSYMQTISSISAARFPYRESLELTLRSMPISLDVIRLLLFDCAMLVDYAANFYAKLMAPVYCACFVIIAYAIAFALRKFAAVDLPCGELSVTGMCIHGSIYNTFFIAVAQQAMALFQCYSHPNKRSSLRDAPNVLCYKGVWGDLVAVAILGIFVFIAGWFALHVFVISMVPKNFDGKAFRLRWKFIYMGYRPEAYWWSMVTLLRGFWISLIGVVPTTGGERALWIGAGLLAYSAACCAVRPWRVRAVLPLDVLANSVLAYVAYADPLLHGIVFAVLFGVLSSRCILRAASPSSGRTGTQQKPLRAPLSDPTLSQLAHADNTF